MTRNKNNKVVKTSHSGKLLKQLLAGVMSASLVFQPFLAHAQIAADPNAAANNRPNIGAAPNGVPLVDIVTPNGKGLSHNKYFDFNVGTPGVILNNHNKEVGTSQLGGVTPGNPNLRYSGSATVILNEVTSGKRSALEGPVEVFGHRADVIIANPNGITCDGCGFINTPRATLTTGLPDIGLDGTLKGFSVKGGDVTFGAKGANLASGKGSVDIFDVVSRTVKIDGPVAGRDVGITAGTGKFDYSSREMKELTDLAGKPEYAIDGSALGALQADRIKIVATEKGVGVRMRNDMAANAGQLSLSANGKISLNNVSGRNGVYIKSDSHTVTAKKVTSKQSVNIKADQGVTLETIGADGDIMVDAGNNLLSVDGDVIALGNVSLASADRIKASQVASGKDTAIKAGQGLELLLVVADNSADIEAQNGNVVLTNGAKAGKGNLNIRAEHGDISAKTLISFNNMTLTAGNDLDVAGNILAQGNIDARIGGRLAASSIASGVDMAETDKNGTLVLSVTGGMALEAATVRTDNLYSAGAIRVASQQVNVSGTILAYNDVALQGQNGAAQSVHFDRMVAHGSTNVTADHVAFTSLIAGGDASFTVMDIDAGNVMGGVDIVASQQSETGDLFLKDSGNITINAQDKITADKLVSAGNIAARANGDIYYNRLISYGSVDLQSITGAISLENDTRAVGNITLTAQVLDLSDNRSKLATAQTLTLNADRISVSNSTLTFGDLVFNSANGLDAQNAQLIAIANNQGGTGDITLNIASLTTDTETAVLASHDLLVKTATIDNSGQLASGNNLALQVTGDFTNRQTGLVYAGRDGRIFVDGTTLNEFGAIQSGQDLFFANSDGSGKNLSLVNKAGFIQSGRDLTILTDYLKNEADSEPEVANSQTNGPTYRFNTPEHYDLLFNTNSKMVGKLFYDGKKEGGTPWGRGASRKKDSGGPTGGHGTVRWLDMGIWKKREDTYGRLTLDDGTTYKAFTWLYSGSTKAKTWYNWNGNAAMSELIDTQYFVHKPAKQGLIQAKGDMAINATKLDNLYSNIEAAGNAQIISDSVTNKGITLYKNTYMTCKAGDTCHAYNADGSRNAAGDIANGASRFVKKEAVDSLSSVIKAGGTLELDVKNLDNTAADGSIAGSANFEAKSSSGKPLDALNGLTAGGALFTPKVDITSGGLVAGQQLPTPKPNSGGFGGTLPNQNFVYETRAAFLDVGKFYGSSYYLNKIGYQPNKQILFLGDAYFENELIDKQMRELLGQGLGKGSFVPGDDAISQMKTLLDNGADYTKKQGLAFGEALTEAQVAALDKSMVIYVKQVVNGTEVYAPVLYVAAKDKASIVSSGAKIEGGDVRINVDNLANSGLITSSTDLRIKGTDILAQGGGFAASGDLILAASGNINLKAATTSLNGGEVTIATDAVRAGGTAILQAQNDVTLSGVGVKADESLGVYGKNVTIDTVTATSADGSQSVTGSNLEAGKNLQIKADQDITVFGSRVHANDQLAMSAENGNVSVQSAAADRKDYFGDTTTQQKSEISSGGNMSLSADKNLVIAGSDVSSGGSLGLKAGEAVAIIATQDKASGTSGKNRFDETTQQGSTVSAASDMAVQAGSDILVGASDLKAGGNIALEAQGDINIVAMAEQNEKHTNSKNYKMNLEETTQVGSSITAGGNITAIVGLDGQSHNLNIIASDIDAGGKVGLKASSDVNILAAEDSYHKDSQKKTKGNIFGGGSTKKTDDNETTTVGSSISGGDGINIVSGNNTTIVASDIMAGTADKEADLNIQTGGNLVVASGTNTSSHESDKKSKGFLTSEKKKKTQYDEENVASSLGATGNVNLNAGDHALISGSNIAAGKDVNIEGNSVSIIGAQENHATSSEKQKSGLGAGSGDGFYSIWGKESKKKTSESTENVGSNVLANGDINVKARESDVNIMGSQLVANNDINLDAARDVNVTPGHESHASSEEKKKSGFGFQLSNTNSSASIGIGFGSSKDTKSEDHSVNAKSGLSAGNDVNINAGRDVNLQAADVAADRDVNIHAVNDVNLLSANDVSNYSEMHEKLFIGVTATVSSGLAGAVDSIRNSVDRVGKGSGMEGIANATIAGANTYGALKNVKDIYKGQSAAFDASITLGFNHSKSSSSSTISSPVVTTIDGGRSVTVEANEGSITGVGTQITAGSNPLWALLDDEKAGDITLKAGQDITLTSAQATQSSKDKSTASGLQGGISLTSMTGTGNAYYDKGKSKSDSTTQVNSHVIGTGDVVLQSGNDTNLKGAVVSGNSVTANIGGNLNIESQLDKEKVKNDHISVSGGFSAGGGANLNVTVQDAKGKSNTVGEQSGIHASLGGFDITVKDNTDLKGGIISSEATGDKNRLETGTLTWSDVDTGSSWKAETKGGGFTIGSGQEGAAGSGPLINPTLKDSDKDKGSAKSAVSPGEIVITNPGAQQQDIGSLNRDTTNTNDAIKGLPDLQSKLNEQLKTQQEWAEAAENLATAVKALSNKIKSSVPDDQKALWDDGGAGRAALHALAGGLLGGVNGVDGAIKGAVGAGLSTIIAPYIKDIVDAAIAQSGLTGTDAKKLSDTLTSSIVLGLLAGTGGSDTAAYAGNELKYNYLTREQLKELEVYFDCLSGDKECSLEEEIALKKRFEELQKISAEQTISMVSTCYSGPSEACSKMISDAKDYINWYRVVNGGNEFYTIEDFDHTQAGRFAPLLDFLLIDAYSRGLYGDDALKEVNKYILRYNSTVGIIGDTAGVVFGGAGCVGSLGLGCAVGATLAVLSANRLLQNGTQLITDEEQLSLIENGLMKAGLSQETATRVLHDIELGVAAVAIVGGGVMLVYSLKNGRVLALGNGGSGGNVGGVELNGNVVITRNGERLLINQGNLPTCGPTSCQMVAHTLEKDIDFGKLITDSKLNNNGVYMNDLSKALSKQNISNEMSYSASISDLSAATARGKPAIVHMQYDTYGHFVVVDGITIRQGQAVVAIRDPAGGKQYFMTIDSFKDKYSGGAIFFK